MNVMFDVIALDGDDTLWHNESVFSVTYERFSRLLEPWADRAALDERLVATETANLRLFGYGVKAFTLSMIETAIDLSDGRIGAEDIRRIIDAGKAMLDHPVELFDGVRETLEALASDYRLMLVTKGDLFHQESKLAQSGVGDLFWRVAIVAEKDRATYLRLLSDHAIDADRFLMVGNSVRSDIIPVLEVGGWAVHVPYDLTWALEAGEFDDGHPRAFRVTRLAEVPALIASFTADPTR